MINAHRSRGWLADQVGLRLLVHATSESGSHTLDATLARVDADALVLRDVAVYADTDTPTSAQECNAVPYSRIACIQAVESETTG